jgi:hypothetical protein
MPRVGKFSGLPHENSCEGLFASTQIGAALRRNGVTGRLRYLMA